MDEKKIVIVGANGQLGKALQLKYPTAKALDKSALDISNTSSVENYDWSDTTHIINAAAYTNVDGAESQEGRVSAWAINANGVSNLARTANKHDLTLVHISSEYVFDGVKNSHKETEDYSPLSVYGSSKAAGDMIASNIDKHYILRTSWVIGDGNNFVRTMINLANRDISPTVVNDQIGRLTFTTELVRAIDHLITNQCDYGIYNLTNDGDPTSWADITREIFKQLDRTDLNVTNTTTAEYFTNKPDSAKRPLYSTLDLGKIKAANFNPKDWRDDLIKYIEEQN